MKLTNETILESLRKINNGEADTTYLINFCNDLLSDREELLADLANKIKIIKNMNHALDGFKTFFDYVKPFTSSWAPHDWIK